MKINKFNCVLLLFVLVFITTAGTLLAGELMDKVFHNDIEAVKKLLAAGADINERDETIGGAGKGATPPSGDGAGYTSLMMAAGNKKPDLVKFLIKNGANVNAKAKDGATPLSMAIKENDVAMIKLLKDLGAKE